MLLYNTHVEIKLTANINELIFNFQSFRLEKRIEILGERNLENDLKEYLNHLENQIEILNDQRQKDKDKIEKLK